MEKKKFRRFDVVTDYSDHHFIKQKNTGKKKNCFTNHRSNVYKRIMREWKSLEKDLPESIFVRVYEQRIDLLRAVIIGAQGTPYHDGLFFFDIAFPFDYPNSPPLVTFRSHGLRLNPNLYENGFVCLSLLNTWPGKANEKWKPEKSTILQVLVSLQGLVLNEKPYYNEPLRFLGGSWKFYNETIFVLSCKTMLFSLQDPPKNFKTFVAAHFRERACTILRACKDYRENRVLVGFFGSSCKEKSKVSSSFKKSMEKLYPDLFAAFSENGACLQNLESALKPENTQKRSVNCRIWSFWSVFSNWLTPEKPEKGKSQAC